jgi:hypothetical protein
VKPNCLRAFCHTSHAHERPENAICRWTDHQRATRELASETTLQLCFVVTLAAPQHPVPLLLWVSLLSKPRLRRWRSEYKTSSRNLFTQVPLNACRGLMRHIRHVLYALTLPAAKLPRIKLGIGCSAAKLGALRVQASDYTSSFDHFDQVSVPRIRMPVARTRTAYDNIALDNPSAGCEARARHPERHRVPAYCMQRCKSH